jgi:hypothetical protein
MEVAEERTKLARKMEAANAAGVGFRDRNTATERFQLRSRKRSVISALRPEQSTCCEAAG